MQKEPLFGLGKEINDKEHFNGTIYVKEILDFEFPMLVDTVTFESGVRNNWHIHQAGLGAALSVAGGVLNIVLDWLFISVFHWGLAGAAIATGLGYALPSVTGVIYFLESLEYRLCLSVILQEKLW